MFVSKDWLTGVFIGFIVIFTLLVLFGGTDKGPCGFTEHQIKTFSPSGELTSVQCVPVDYHRRN